MLLFDIDGVIRDVSGSYRRAIVETVHHYCGWRPEPAAIDALKAEGCWNNDWKASAELIRRHRADRGETGPPPEFSQLVAVFGSHYFGGDPDGDPGQWRGFIGDEPLLVDAAFFSRLSRQGLAWGFVSGAEPPSCRFVLQTRLGLPDPPLVAMGDAPDKPDPTGLIHLARALLQRHGAPPLGPDAPPVAYLGDTVADVQTVLAARRQLPQQRWISLAVAPPHLARDGGGSALQAYESVLRRAGADLLLPSTDTAGDRLLHWLQTARG
ncbi:MAG: TIGR01548 family HAD-type hydrolase [Synechococcaceae cyanobacterium]|nr:TIGR01548 family HAD-type hydrolase [Synechococcaceae cyanobacterium]